LDFSAEESVGINDLSRRQSRFFHVSGLFVSVHYVERHSLAPDFFALAAIELP